MKERKETKMSNDIVLRLREGVFGSDETKTDAVIHSYMQAAAVEIEQLRTIVKTMLPTASDLIEAQAVRIKELETDLAETRKERDQYLSELMYLENGESM